MADEFPKVNVLTRGYDPQPVQEFFKKAREAYEGGVPSEVFSAEDVRRAAFPLKRGGYNTAAVDSALNRLESAFVQRDRADFTAVHGEAEWFGQVTQRATALYPRLLRPAGDRFAHPEGRGKGYDCQQVDELLDRVTAYFDEHQQLEVADVRFALFDSASGTKAYDEAQVDTYLAAVVNVLLSVA